MMMKSIHSLREAGTYSKRNLIRAVAIVEENPRSVRRLGQLRTPKLETADRPK
jgi:hypothetical protein